MCVLLCIYHILFPVHFQYIFLLLFCRCFFHLFWPVFIKAMALYQPGQGLNPAAIARLRGRKAARPDRAKNGLIIHDNSTNFLCLARMLNLEILTIYHIFIYLYMIYVYIYIVNNLGTHLSTIELLRSL